MHQRGFEARDGRSPARGVDGVEVAGGACERGHFVRGRHLDSAQQTTRRAFDLIFDAAVVRCLRRQRVGVGAASDRESLRFDGHQRAVLRAVFHVDGHDAAGCGFEVVFRPAGEVDLLAGVLKQFAFACFETYEMVEVHRVEQAFDHRETVHVHGSEGRVDRRPCRSYERIRCDVRGHEFARQRASGGGFMVESKVGRQRVACVRFAERTFVGVVRIPCRFDGWHFGELVSRDGGVADSRGGGQHAVHVLRQSVAVHHREQSGLACVHVQRDDDVAHGVL